MESKINIELSEDEYLLLTDLAEIGSILHSQGLLKKVIRGDFDKIKSLSKKLDAAADDKEISGKVNCTLYKGDFARRESDEWDLFNSKLLFDEEFREVGFYEVSKDLGRLEWMKGNEKVALGKDYAKYKRLSYWEKFKVVDPDIIILNKTWVNLWKDKWLQEFRKHGVKRIKFKLLARLKMAIWTPK